MSDRSHGDLRLVPGDGRALARRRALVDRPWTTVRQVHESRVAVLGPGAAVSPAEEADAVVTAVSGKAIAVLGADCALVGLASDEGVLGVAHAGWRGLAAGVVERTVEAMRGLGASGLVAVLGPCIHPECYAFGADDLARVASRLGSSVVAETATGAPALDLPAAVRAALVAAGVEELVEMGGCTACGDRWYSHRARREEARHALVLWRDER